MSTTTEGGQVQTTERSRVKIARALLSVSDKSGLVEFARGLSELGVELISTGGTAAALTEAGIPVREVSNLTGFPEIMDGRVKTLHPKLHGGILARRDSKEHLDAAQEHEIELIDLVCVNLYPFRETVARPDVTEAEAIENIDIGGPAMIRAAAKNSASVAVVVAPGRYEQILRELRENQGTTSLELRRELMREAFAHTAAYDTAIASWFGVRSGVRPPGGLTPDLTPYLVRTYERECDLSYGENPHQRAAYYRDLTANTHLLSGVEQLGGKQLSFNNLLDLHSARALAREFEEPACVIVKHNNPCGCAVANSAAEAYAKAFACDPTSAFGGVIVFNREIDGELAGELKKQFIEVLFAHGFTEEALTVLREKEKLRILVDRERAQPDPAEVDLRYVTGGLLIQERDRVQSDPSEWQTVSQRQPSEQELANLRFAWTVCAHVRSNAIVLARDGATLGIGAGQMSRVDSVRLAVEKFQGDSLKDAVLASDAFFPFADGPELAVEAGIGAIVQPGGSIRDEEVVAAADTAGVAMVLTGRRHFRH